MSIRCNPSDLGSHSWPHQLDEYLFNPSWIEIVRTTDSSLLERFWKVSWIKPAFAPDSSPEAPASTGQVPKPSYVFRLTLRPLGDRFTIPSSKYPPTGPTNFVLGPQRTLNLRHKVRYTNMYQYKLESVLSRLHILGRTLWFRYTCTWWLNTSQFFPKKKNCSPAIHQFCSSIFFFLFLFLLFTKVRYNLDRKFTRAYQGLV